MIRKLKKILGQSVVEGMPSVKVWHVAVLFLGALALSTFVGR